MGTRPRRKKCPWCGHEFDPHPRLAQRQKSCGSDDCKRQQNLAGQRRWKRREREVYLSNQRDWRRGHPGYWREYRHRHPAYTERNRIQTRIRRALSRRPLQKKLDILQVTEKSIQYWHMTRFAKSPRSLYPLLFAYAGGRERSYGRTQSQAP